MSLTRTLLNGGMYSSIDTSMYDYSGQFVGESYELDTICESLMKDIYAVDRAYHIADIIGECKVLTEGADPSVLLEGIAGGAMARLKELWKKFLAKIKEFFAAIKRQFLLITKHGKDFINTFKKELNNKNAKGYKYTGVKYTIDKGKATGKQILDAVDKEVNTILGNSINAAERPTSLPTDFTTTTSLSSSNTSSGGGAMLYAWLANDKNAYKDIDSVSDYQDKFVEGLKLGCSDTSELTEKLEEEYRDGDTTAQELEDFEGTSKSAMMSFIENAHKNEKEFTDAEKKFTKMCEGIIKGLDKMDKESVKKQETTNTYTFKDTNVDNLTSKTKYSDKQSDAIYKAAQAASSMMSSLMTVGKIPTSVGATAIRSAAADYERILKGYLRFKPAKESYYGMYEGKDTSDDEDDDIVADTDVKEGYNLIDQAMGFTW